MSVTFGDPQRATFDVHGSTLSAVATALSQRAEAGTTEWHPSYSLASDGQSAATVTVPAKITMPRWVEYASASQADQAEWDRFYAALEAHEQGHIAIVQQQLGGVDQQLAGQSASVARQTWATALQQLQAASDTYDTTTNHGINQGTVINVSSSTPDGGQSQSTDTTTADPSSTNAQADQGSSGAGGDSNAGDLGAGVGGAADSSATDSSVADPSAADSSTPDTSVNDPSS